MIWVKSYRVGLNSADFPALQLRVPCDVKWIIWKGTFDTHSLNGDNYLFSLNTYGHAIGFVYPGDALVINGKNMLTREVY